MMTSFIRRSEGHCGEALADLILGKIDALEFGPDLRELEDWRLLLDSGLRVPIVGGSGKYGNAACLGWPRTYARLLQGEEFNYKNWIEAIRAGRTFVTTGPLIYLTINGHGPGSMINLPSGRDKVHVRVEASNLGPLGALQLVGNRGGVIAGINAHDKSSAVLEGDYRLMPGWLAASCQGQEPGPDGRKIFALTSPVYIQIEGQPAVPAADGVRILIDQLDRGLAWINLKGRFQTTSQREHLTNIFWTARSALVALTQGPYRFG
jgi:hypothetical protein